MGADLSRELDRTSPFDLELADNATTRVWSLTGDEPEAGLQVLREAAHKLSVLFLPDTWQITLAQLDEWGGVRQETVHQQQCAELPPEPCVGMVAAGPGRLRIGLPGNARVEGRWTVCDDAGVRHPAQLSAAPPVDSIATGWLTSRAHLSSHFSVALDGLGNLRAALSLGLAWHLDRRGQDQRVRGVPVHRWHHASQAVLDIVETDLTTQGWQRSA